MIARDIRRRLHVPAPDVETGGDAHEGLSSCGDYGEIVELGRTSPAPRDGLRAGVRFAGAVDGHVADHELCRLLAIQLS